MKTYVPYLAFIACIIGSGCGLRTLPSDIAIGIAKTLRGSEWQKWQEEDWDADMRRYRRLLETGGIRLWDRPAAFPPGCIFEFEDEERAWLDLNAVGEDIFVHPRTGSEIFVHLGTIPAGKELAEVVQKQSALYAVGRPIAVHQEIIRNKHVWGRMPSRSPEDPWRFDIRTGWEFEWEEEHTWVRAEFMGERWGSGFFEKRDVVHQVLYATITPLKLGVFGLGKRPVLVVRMVVPTTAPPDERKRLEEILQKSIRNMCFKSKP